MDYKCILNMIEQVFVSCGFNPVIIKGDKYWKYKECYCKITFLKEWNVFVIESADSFQDAKAGILEDGDLYDMDIPERELLCQLKSDLEKYYMND